MGWSYCGDDSKGRPIGYSIDAHCDYPGCYAPIHRGLAYACGGMHGDGTSPESDYPSCEGYFCERHMRTPYAPDGNDIPNCPASYCLDCADEIEQEFGEEVMEVYREVMGVSK